MQSIIALGKKIYDLDNPREKHRMLVFVVRSYLHRKQMRSLVGFFGESEQKKYLAVEPI